MILSRYLLDYNLRKLQVLFLGLREILCSRSLSDELGLTIHNASTILRHYHEMGLFNRWRDGRMYYYVITERGWDRYWYLLGKTRCRVKKPGLDWSRLARERCLIKDLGIREVEDSLDWLRVQRHYIGK